MIVPVPVKEHLVVDDQLTAMSIQDLRDLLDKNPTNTTIQNEWMRRIHWHGCGLNLKDTSMSEKFYRYLRKQEVFRKMIHCMSELGDAIVSQFSLLKVILVCISIGCVFYLWYWRAKQNKSEANDKKSVSDDDDENGIEYKPLKHHYAPPPSSRRGITLQRNYLRRKILHFFLATSKILLFFFTISWLLAPSTGEMDVTTFSLSAIFQGLIPIGYGFYLLSWCCWCSRWLKQHENEFHEDKSALDDKAFEYKLLMDEETITSNRPSMSEKFYRYLRKHEVFQKMIHCKQDGKEGELSDEKDCGETIDEEDERVADELLSVAEGCDKEQSVPESSEERVETVADELLVADDELSILEKVCLFLDKLDKLNEVYDNEDTTDHEEDGKQLDDELFVPEGTEEKITNRKQYEITREEKLFFIGFPTVLCCYMLLHEMRPSY